MTKFPYISIVLPTKDEEKTIGSLVDGVRRYGDEVMIVDGHSNDKTVQIAREHGARVVYDNGKGKGDGVRVAIKEAKGDIIVFVDADGSHDPEDIPRLLQPILDNKADLVIGSRMRGGSDELHGRAGELLRLWGSGVITLVINLWFRQNFTDYQNGFRAIKTGVARALRLREDYTTIEQEMSIECLRGGYRLAEVPTHEYCRLYGASHVSLWRHGPWYIVNLVKTLLRL